MTTNQQNELAAHKSNRNQSLKLKRSQIKKNPKKNYGPNKPPSHSLNRRNQLPNLQLVLSHPDRPGSNQLESKKVTYSCDRTTLVWTIFLLLQSYFKRQNQRCMERDLALVGREIRRENFQKDRPGITFLARRSHGCFSCLSSKLLRDSVSYLMLIFILLILML